MIEVNNPCTEEQNVPAVNYRKLVLLAGFASVATAISLILMKAAVWFFSGSSTILASLTDSLIDCCASFINLLALRFALTPADKDHRFGHYKAEALAALTQAAFISGSSILLIVHGFERLQHPEIIGYIDAAIIVTTLSLLITVCLVSFQSYVYKKTSSEAINADRYHYLSDILLNVGVVASLILSRFNFAWADGLFTVILGFYILHSAYHIGKTAIATLLDKSMPPAENAKLMALILGIDGVLSLHDLKTRQAGPHTFIQCHIVLDGNMPLTKAHKIASEAENAIKIRYPDSDITIHMEPDTDDTYKDVEFMDEASCPISPERYNQIKDKNGEINC